MKLMYISDGEMCLFDGADARVIPSQRVDQYARTLRELEQQHAWKTEGEGAKFMHKVNPYANAAERQRGVVTGLAPYRGGVLYAVDLGRTGGVYTKDPLSPEEPEGLVTSAVGLHAQDFAACEDGFYLAMHEGAQRHIARMDPATGNYEFLTEGDTLERHPFPSKDGRSIHFDMCGFARNEQQQLTARGPSAIVSLNLISGDIREVYADAATEYLKYTESADGTQRMLVRPYQEKRRGSNPLGCLLAPFSDIAGFIYLFSSLNNARKGKEPPMSSSGPEAAQQREQPLYIDGVAIDPKQIAREQARSKDDYPGLIPRDWTLQRVLGDGSLEVVQRGVLDYLPLGDGGYIYSNGAHVFRVVASGARSHLFKAHLATDFILLGE